MLARSPRTVSQAEAALAAPFAGFAEVEVFPTFAGKAAAYASRLVRHHPLVDGNKRAARVVMREFVMRNGRSWRAAPGGDDEEAEVIEQLAAGTLAEADFIAWVADRID